MRNLNVILAMEVSLYTRYALLMTGRLKMWRQDGEQWQVIHTKFQETWSVTPYNTDTHPNTHTHTDDSKEGRCRI